MALGNQAIQQRIAAEVEPAQIRRYEEEIHRTHQGHEEAESKLEPALAPLRDQVLFMKHNLNARAIAGLSDEVVSVQTNVDKLVRDIETAIAQADAFIASLQAE